jgi:hypothetical protein
VRRDPAGKAPDSLGKGLVVMLRILGLVMLAALLAAVPARAAEPRELLLEGTDNIIEVTLNGAPVRLEVTAEAFGPAVINPAVAEQLALVPNQRRGWRFGPVSVEGRGTSAMIGFGHEAREVTVVWADSPVNTRADGMIGIHHLPYDRVTLALRASQPGEVVERLELKRVGRLFGNTRIGTPVKAGKRELLAIFVPEFTPHNLITAPTATFLATHLDGGFTKEPASTVNMRFGVMRPIRTMLLSQPLEIGSLAVTRFAVRYEDYGSTAPVGEVAENDPRFEKGRILVSARKGQGRPDLLTRIGAEQLSACSRLTYDLAASAIELACLPEPE